MYKLYLCKKKSMADLFQKHNKRKKLKDTLHIGAFYTVLLFSFSLLLVVISNKNTICLTHYFCADSKTQWFKASFILYLYFLFLVIILIQIYKLLEKIVAKKNHIQYFKYILYSIPLIVLLVIWLVDAERYESMMILVFSAIMSILGLLMIEFRKKK